MSIEIRKRGKNKIYYLARSYRKGTQILKIRILLGRNLLPEEVNAKAKESEHKLSEKLDYVKRIIDPYDKVLSLAELEELKAIQPNNKIKLLHLSEQEWLNFTEAFTYDTNAIEGSTILKDEVKQIIENNKWPDKPRDEISETLGVKDTVRYLRTNGDHLSLKLIEDLHYIIFKNSKPFAGKLRPRGVEVAIMDARRNIVHRGAPSEQVPYLLRKLVKWYEENRGRYPPLVLAAVVHNQFEMIHPFQDGNGRVGRLLLINILIKHKMPPINIELKNRSEYYAALSAYENEGNLRLIIELLLKEYKALGKQIKKH